MSNCVCHINGYEIKDAEARLRLNESEFTNEALLKAIQYDMDFLTIDVFKTTNAINSSADDGAYVIANCYNSTKHEIVIPANTTKTIRCNIVEIEHNVRGYYVHIEKSGTGSIDAKLSFDGGTTFEDVTQDTFVSNYDNGKNLVMQLILTGDVTLKNIYWGGRY